MTNKSNIAEGVNKNGVSRLTSVVNYVYETRDYDKFRYAGGNRNVRLDKYKAKLLEQSMKDDGWIDSFPMTVFDSGEGYYEILDGQHRFAIAVKLSLGIKYVEVSKKLDIAKINNTQDTWSIRDYIERWKNAGKKDYFEIDEFRDTHPSIPLGLSISILGGSISFSSSTRRKFFTGKFTITPKARGLAYRIGNVYEEIIKANNDARHANHLKAIYGCFHVEDFDPERLVESCQKYPHMIQNYSKMEDWLEMIEEIYNHNKKSGRIPLKFQAQDAMRQKSPIKQ